MGQQASGSGRAASRTLNPFAAFASMGAQAQAMLIGILIMTVGQFMIIPLLALYLQVSLGESPARIGVVLTVVVVTAQGLPVITGMLSDRWGPRALLLIGIACRSLGFVGFALGHGFPLFVVSALLVGVGGAAFTPAAKAVLAQTSGPMRVEAFALRSAAVNAGAAVGPLIGGLFFTHFQLVFGVAVALQAAYLVVLLVAVRSQPQPAAQRPRLGGIFVAMVGDRALLGLTVASIGFWFLYTQFNFTFSLYSRDAFGLTGQVGLLFAANAVIVLALQYVLIARLSRRLGGWGLCVTGATVLATGFGCLAVLPSVGALVLFTVLFSLGELLIVPTLDTLASDISPMVTVGSYLGFVSIGWALGGVAGNLLGGALYAIARSAGSFPQFWGVNVAVGLVTAAAFLLLGRLVHPRSAAPAAAGHPQVG